MRPCCSPRMSLRISPNCLTSWLTCCTVVPEPFAIRSRREPLMSSGRRRSSGVSVQQVNQLVKQFDQMRKLMRGIQQGKMPDLGQLMRQR